MYSEDEEQEQKVALMVVLGVVILLVLSLLAWAGLGGLAQKVDAKTPTKPAVAHTAEPAAPVAAPTAAPATEPTLKDNESAVMVENGVVKFYFASGQSDLAKGGKEALADVVKGIAAGQKARISGYHDSTGDPAKNAELAKKRALSVRDELVALGVAADKVELVKPEQAQITGNSSAARRVEVSLIQ
ncbi:MAG: OmpA family protein [Formosimonas sp.]